MNVVACVKIIYVMKEGSTAVQMTASYSHGERRYSRKLVWRKVEQ
jgi:hypothetical protein